MFVRFKAVGFHTPPNQFFAIRRENRVHIVTHIAVGEVLGLFGFKVIQINVCVRTFSEFFTRKFFAGIGQLFAVGAPGNFLNTAERRIGTVEFLVLQQIDCIVAFGIVGDEDVAVSAVCPVVPVAVHQVVVNHRIGFWQVGIALFDGGVYLHIHRVSDVFHIRCVAEAVDVAIHLGELFGVGAIGIAFPDLRALVVTI